MERESDSDRQKWNMQLWRIIREKSQKDTQALNQQSDPCERWGNAKGLLLGVEGVNRKGCFGVCLLTLYWIRGSINFVPWGKA